MISASLPGLGRTRSGRAMAAVAALALVAPAARGAVYLVDRSDDSAVATACNPAVPSDCSLRGAILAANANPGLDLIVFNLGGPLGRVALVTIPRSGTDTPAEGDLDITGDLIIDGGSGQGVTVLGGAGFNDRILDVAAGVQATLRDLRIQNGDVTSQSECGGGLRSAGDTLVERCEIALNTSASGGGVCTASDQTRTLTMRRSSVIENTATNRGGGIYHNGGSLVLEQSTISGNSASNFGGALFVGFLFATGITVESSTFADNITATPGNADLWVHELFAGTIGMHATVVDGDCRDIFGAIESSGGNIESPDFTCPLDPMIDQVAVPDVGLDPLERVPGLLARSHRPRPGSPAIDDPLGTIVTCPSTDQRQQPRPMDGDGDGVAECDAGAVERDPPIFVDGFESGDTSAWSSAVP